MAARTHIWRISAARTARCVRHCGYLARSADPVLLDSRTGRHAAAGAVRGIGVRDRLVPGDLRQSRGTISASASSGIPIGATK